MSEKKPFDFTKTIQAVAADGKRRRLLGKSLYAENIFQFLCQQTDIRCQLLLCTDFGLILGYTGSPALPDVSGLALPADAFSKLQRAAQVYRLKGYIIAAPSETSDDLVMEKSLLKLQSDMNQLLRILDENEQQSQCLLRSLDSMRNAISIYDRNARLLFGNRTFCSNFQIEDLDTVLGMHIEDIMARNSLKAYSMEDNSSHMKMMDVLKDGKEVLDWEVRLESPDSASNALLVSNDMYPVRDNLGRVQGMVELMRSRQQDMTRAKKMVSFTAEHTFDNIIGHSAVMRERIRLAKEFANSPFNFLVTGESGVGKELFAQSIHNYSSRRKGPFVALNCANFSESLIESELFGYVGGAFTGASKNGQIGKLELADGGSLFLDEIGELPFHFQAKLLRVLETWLVTRIGSSKEIPVNVRIIAATNRDLEQMVEDGLFRQDLYYRLQVLTVDIPPLRDRGQDILLLANSFLHQAAEASGSSVKVLEPQARNTLMEYDWPGNVRELRNVINRATVLAKSGSISHDVLETAMYAKGKNHKTPLAGSPGERLQKRRQAVDDAHADLMREALNISGGNKKKAAELLGVSRKTFYRMLEKYTI